MYLYEGKMITCFFENDVINPRIKCQQLKEDNLLSFKHKLFEGNSKLQDSEKKVNYFLNKRKENITTSNYWEEKTKDGDMCFISEF